MKLPEANKFFRQNINPKKDDLGQERPRRIAEIFAGTPYRVLSSTVPYDFDHIVPGLKINGQEVNIKAAEQMLREQAPIIYADDVFDDMYHRMIDGNISVKDLVENGDKKVNTKNMERYWVEVFKMLSSPRVIPPFEHVFIDAIVPEPFQAKSNKSAVASIAAFVQMDPIKKLFPSKYEEVHLELCSFYTRSFLSMEVEARGEPADSWEDNDNLIDDTLERMMSLKMVGIFPYYQRNNDEIFGPWSVSIYALDEDYKVLKPKNARHGDMMLCHFDISEVKRDEPLSEESIASIKMNNDRIAAITLQTISLLNCSNVSLVETGKTNQDLTKNKREFARLPYVRHYELRVKVGENVVRVNGRSENGHSLCPLHQVRGHFRDYSTGKGLFGKYHYDCVWVPNYVRGKVEDGIVSKDYVLEKADEETSVQH